MPDKEADGIVARGDGTIAITTHHANIVHVEESDIEKNIDYQNDDNYAGNNVEITDTFYFGHASHGEQAADEKW